MFTRSTEAYCALQSEMLVPSTLAVRAEGFHGNFTHRDQTRPLMSFFQLRASVQEIAGRVFRIPLITTVVDLRMPAQS